MAGCFLWTLLFVLVVLKFCGVIAASWWLVLIPLWVLLFVGLIGVIVAVLD